MWSAGTQGEGATCCFDLAINFRRMSSKEPDCAAEAEGCSATGGSSSSLSQSTMAGGMDGSIDACNDDSSKALSIDSFCWASSMP